MGTYISSKKWERKLNGAKEASYKITKINNEPITADDIEEFYEDLEKRDPNMKIRIRAMGPVRMTTLKGYSTELNIKDYDDYFYGKVVDESKFSNFSYLEITVLKPNRN